MMQFITIKNFEKFQHYRDRKPPWIKLYRDLLADDRLFDLSEADRFQLIGLFIIASQHDNLIPNKPAWLRSELRINRPISLKSLIASGWIEVVEQDASGALAASKGIADCKHEPIVETEKRRDREETEAETYLPHGEFGWAKLTATQEGKLRDHLGLSFDTYIARFDRWVNEAPKAKANGVLRQDRHAYESILNWADKDGTQTVTSAGGKKHAERETDNDKNNRAIQDFIARSMAPEVRSDVPDVREEPERLPRPIRLLS